MNPDIISVTVHLAGCDYRFSCPPADRDELLEAGRYLDQKMRLIRDQSGKNLAVESMVMMAALNISHELLSQQRESAETETRLNRRLQELLQKMDATLNQMPQLPAIEL